MISSSHHLRAPWFSILIIQTLQRRCEMSICKQRSVRFAERMNPSRSSGDIAHALTSHITSQNCCVSGNGQQKPDVPEASALRPAVCQQRNAEDSDAAARVSLPISGMLGHASSPRRAGTHTHTHTVAPATALPGHLAVLPEMTKECVCLKWWKLTGKGGSSRNQMRCQLQDIASSLTQKRDQKQKHTWPNQTDVWYTTAKEDNDEVIQTGWDQWGRLWKMWWESNTLARLQHPEGLQ